MVRGRDTEKKWKKGGDLSEPTRTLLQWREGGFSLDALQHPGCLCVRVCK